MDSQSVETTLSTWLQSSQVTLVLPASLSQTAIPAPVSFSISATVRSMLAVVEMLLCFLLGCLHREQRVLYSEVQAVCGTAHTQVFAVKTALLAEKYQEKMLLGKTCVISYETEIIVLPWCSQPIQAQKCTELLPQKDPASFNLTSPVKIYIKCVQNIILNFRLMCIM